MTLTFQTRCIAVLLISMVAGCAVSNVPPPPPEHEIASIARHLKAFADSDNPSEGPGGPGEVRAIQYAEAYFQTLGLKTTILSVPLVRVAPSATTIEVRGPKGQVLNTNSTSGQSFIVWPGRQVEQVSLDAEIVFAGYGIVAPEYNRDDFKTVDVKGKIVLVLDGSPQTGQRDDLGELGETSYGTRYYKYEEAARHGAVAVLIIHGTGDTPWDDIREEDTGSQLAIDAPAADRSDRPQVEGWLSGPAAEKLFTFAAVDHQSMYQLARENGFQPIPIPGISVSMKLAGRATRATTRSVIAVLPGQTAEYVVVAGRWNRIDQASWAATAAPGIQHTAPLDDDGSAAAMVMETAAQLVREHGRPLRTVVFMVTSALKPGIVGLHYYLDHPIPGLPISNLAALLFLDRADMTGTSQSVGKIGTSSDGALSQITREASIEQGRLVELDENQARRFYYKFSQGALAKEGVRVIYLTTRIQEGLTAINLRRVASRDDVAGVTVIAPPVTPATVQDPTRDAFLLAAITSRVANATNWPPRVEPPPEPPR